MANHFSYCVESERCLFIVNYHSIFFLSVCLHAPCTSKLVSKHKHLKLSWAIFAFSETFGLMKIFKISQHSPHTIFEISSGMLDYSMFVIFTCLHRT